VIEKIFLKKVKNMSKESFENELTKNDFMQMELLFLNFLLSKILIKKMMYSKMFFEDLVLLIVKKHLPMHLVESQWLKRFSLHLCPRVVLPFMKLFTREILLELVEKTKQLYMLPALAYCYFVTSFDLWMSKGAYKIFIIVIKFCGVEWQLKHIVIGFFEAFDTFGHALAKDVVDLLNKYDLRKKMIAYVKDEGFNLNTMTIALKSIISYDILNLRKFSR
jgi:hypothetical protein